jgi:hypothetical protein
MAELVDALVSNTCGNRAGSTCSVQKTASKEAVFLVLIIFYLHPSIPITHQLF